MINRIILTLIVTMFLGGTWAQAQSAVTKPSADKAPAEVATASGSSTAGAAAIENKATLGYDPKRDAEVDVKEAIGEAARTGKRVMVEVGGEWCIWCHRLEEFFTAHPELIKTRDANFVVVKVNFSEENENKGLLDQYPKVAGYPHIFILGPDGSVLKSQDTGELEDGKKSYTLEKVAAFLKAWSPAKQ